MDPRAEDDSTLTTFQIRDRSETTAWAKGVRLLVLKIMTVAVDRRLLARL